MDLQVLRNSVWMAVFLFAAAGFSGGESLRAQVVDADCFSGDCGGSSGIPQCPEGFDEVGFVLYANSKANATEDCETVVSCTNLGKKTVGISCRFFHGFFPIQPDTPGGSLCSTMTPVVRPGDTTECATDAKDEVDFQAGGIFLGADGNCPAFEGKGLVCVEGGDAKQVFCEAHLSCGNGTALENLTIIQRKAPKKNKKDKDE